MCLNVSGVDFLSCDEDVIPQQAWVDGCVDDEGRIGKVVTLEPEQIDFIFIFIFSHVWKAADSALPVSVYSNSTAL